MQVMVRFRDRHLHPWVVCRTKNIVCGIDWARSYWVFCHRGWIWLNLPRMLSYEDILGHACSGVVDSKKSLNIWHEDEQRTRIRERGWRNIRMRKALRHLHEHLCRISRFHDLSWAVWVLSTPTTIMDIPFILEWDDDGMWPSKERESLDKLRCSKPPPLSIDSHVEISQDYQLTLFLFAGLLGWSVGERWFAKKPWPVPTPSNAGRMTEVRIVM